MPSIMKTDGRLLIRNQKLAVDQAEAIKKKKKISFSTEAEDDIEKPKHLYLKALSGFLTANS